MMRRLSLCARRRSSTRQRSRRCVALLAVASLGLVPQSASAQDSRADVLAEARAKKAAALTPYEPSAAERWLDRAEDFLVDPPTVYPWVGSILRGGLLAGGVGVNKPFRDSGRFAAHAAWSIRNYKTVAGQAALPALAGGRVRPSVSASWIDAPAVNVYELGVRDTRDERAQFGFSPRRAGGEVRTLLAPGVEVGGGVEFLHVDTNAGKGDDAAGQSFTPATLPGLGASPTYLHSRVFAGYDWRDSPGYTRRGGAYRIEWQDYRQRDQGPYGFRRVDAQVDQAFPILRANWVLAFHGAVATTDTDGGRVVPFFLMPDLGGNTLRGYPAWRFRDRHSLLVSGEYRWTPSQFVDMALFYDAGKVTAARRDLDLRGLRRSYGLGIRFHAPAATVLRADLARTDEGFGLVLAFSPAF
ncbi:MAG TPA: BamA/TamA family outer membrane protein [Luteitalea sp.]|nr:BamA/TamA family outer membrane protein [Luteitalea sp.]